VLRKKDVRIIETSQVSFLRLVSGYTTCTDYVRNMIIHNALQMYALEERIQDCKNKWYNHILRMDSSRLIQKVKNYHAHGRRNIGPTSRPWESFL
jgi:hypothetical protein